jgi:hypothetical protein
VFMFGDFLQKGKLCGLHLSMLLSLASSDSNFSRITA